MAIAISIESLLEEQLAHLGAAKMQLLPREDAIIGEHLAIAIELARQARKAARDAARDHASA